MNINYLNKQELGFQLRSRGVTPPEKVEDRRKLLRTVLNSVKMFPESFPIAFCLAVEENRADLMDTLSHLEVLITSLEIAAIPNDIEKFRVIFHFFKMRLAHLKPESAADCDFRSWVVMKVSALEDRFEGIVSPGDIAAGCQNPLEDDSQESTQSVVFNPRKVHASTPARNPFTTVDIAPTPDWHIYQDTEDIQKIEVETSAAPFNFNVTNPFLADSLKTLDLPVASVPLTLSTPVATDRLGSRRTRYSPVHKWGLSFSGDTTVSVTSFLERVQELQLARDVSHEELFDSASDLFTGKALVWYRGVRPSMTCWQDVESLLKETFLPSNYNDDLLTEIKERTQGAHENVSLYIATMQGLFNKLCPVPTVPEQLRIIRKNLLPYFMNHLALRDIETIPELNKLCRKLAECKTQVGKFKPPPTKLGLLEPEMACLTVGSGNQPRVQFSRPPVKYRPNSPPNRNVNPTRRCWNCSDVGHLAPACPNPRTVYCFGCGRQGVMRQNCPRCSENVRPSGNEASNRVQRDNSVAPATPRPATPIRPAVLVPRITRK